MSRVIDITGVRPDELYLLEDVQKLTKLGSTSFRAMRREGLPVKYKGGRGFVYGKHLIDHILDTGKDTK